MLGRASRRSAHARRFAGRRAVAALAAVAGLAVAAVTTGTLTSAPAAGTSADDTAAAVRAAWPESKGDRAVPSTIEVPGTFNGRMRRYHGAGDLGDGGQEEGQKALFTLQDGAVLKNVVLGAPAADGVHCLGSCTLQNVWWEDVGEDAATFKGESDDNVYIVYGGGARKAYDKVFQFNGAGKMVMAHFQVDGFGKLVRSCGDCSPQYRRSIIVRDVDVLSPGDALVGVNANYGDTAALREIRVHGDDARDLVLCERYRGNDSDDAPTRTGRGSDGTHCRYTASDVTYH